MLKSKRTVAHSLATLLLLLMTGVGGLAQVSINSPYSRYGMGDLVMRKTTYNFSMGGVANAISSQRYINPYNPAANAAFDTLSFIFSGGMVSKFGTMSTTNMSSATSYASLGYLLFGFPVNRHIKTSIGLMPYSNVGYKIVSGENLPDIGNTDFYFEGTGGTNEFFLSASFQLHKNLAIGAKGTYMFGMSERAKAIFFPDSIGYINTRIDNQIELGDLYFDFGLQYNKQLANDLTLGLGAVYAPAQNISAHENYLARSYFATAAGIESYRDTIDSRLGLKGSVTIPEKYGFGFLVKSQERWLIAADVNWQNWSEFESFGVRDSLENSMQIAVGGEFLPSERSIDTYWKRIRYRIGFRYHKTYLNLYENQINEFGITFGMGLPIPRSFSTLNVGFEVGRSGTTASNLIQDSFIRINLGVSIWERWFVQRRYY
jgi:hypothetical protein